MTTPMPVMTTRRDMSGPVSISLADQPVALSPCGTAIGSEPPRRFKPREIDRQPCQRTSRPGVDENHPWSES